MTWLGVLFALGTLSSVQGQTWDGGGGDANWSTGLNWASDLAPAASSSLVFDGLAQVANTNDFAAGTQFNGLTFASTAGVFVIGGNSINLGGNIVNNSTNAQTLNMGLDLLQDTQFNAVGGITAGGQISGNFDLVKTGTGTLTLSGANGFTGDLIVKAGSVALGATGSLVATTPVYLGGTNTAATTASLSAAGVGGTTKTVGGVTLTQGRTGLSSSRSSGSGSFTLDVGSISRQAGSTLAVSTSNSTVHTSSANATGVGILGGWARSSTNTDWLTVNGSGNLVAYTGYTDLALVNGGSVSIASDASSNVRLTGAAQNSGVYAVNMGSGVTDISTLLQGAQPTAGSSATPSVTTVNIGSGNTLRLGQYGGVLVAPSNSGTFNASYAQMVFAGGKLTAGGADNTSGEIVFSSSGLTSSSSGDNTSRNFSAIVVNSDVVNNGTGVVSVIVDSDRTVAFNGTGNTYTGKTYVNRGRLISSVTGNLGTGDVIVNSGTTNGAQVNLTGGGTYTNNFTIAGAGYGGGVAGALYLQNNTGISGNITLSENSTITAVTTTNSTLSGKISGTGTLTLAQSGGSSYVLNNSTSDWTGGLTLSRGGTSGSQFVNVSLGAALDLNGGDLTLNAGGSNGQNSVIMGLTGNSLTVNGLNSAGTGTGSSPPRVVRNSTSAATTATLTVGSGNGNGTFDGTITNGNAAAVLNLAKTGTGTQTLVGLNSYTGTTVVNGGTLLISGTLTATSGVTVNTGGNFRYDNNAAALDRSVTINGGKFSYNSTSNYTGALTFTSGTIGGSNISNLNLTIGTGQIMAPGNSTGTMAAGATTWANGGTFQFELNDAAGAAGSTTAGWDLLNAASLDIAAGVGQFTIQIVSLDALQAAGLAQNFNGANNYSWLFVDAGADITGFNANKFVFSDSFLNSTPGTFSVSQGSGLDADKLYINYTGVIPEPTTYAMLLGGLGLLAFLRRRSKI